MHLIKDIWDRFYILCRKSNEEKQTDGSHFIYPTSTLLHIILNKVEQHPNGNVPKYCIQSLLAAPAADTTQIFEHL